MASSTLQPGPRPRRGQALVVAILALTVLMAGAIALSAAARFELRAAQRGVESLRREAALRGAVNRGMALLEEGRSDPARLLQVLRDNRELRWMPLAEGGSPDEPPMQIAVQILDASARLNLNTADSGQLQKLLGLKQEEADALVQWRTEKNEESTTEEKPLGSERRPYLTKHRPFDTLEELLLLPEVNPALFFGAPTQRETEQLPEAPLSELLAALSGENNASADGSARTDVNTATAEDLLASANRDGQILQDAQATSLAQRDREKQPYQSVLEVLQGAQIPQQHWGPMLDVWTVDRRSFLPGRVNVNTASKGVLQTLGLSEEMVDQIMEQRGLKAEGLDWADLLKITIPSSGGGAAGQPQDPKPEEPKPSTGVQAQQQQPDPSPPANGPQAPQQPSVPIEKLFATRSAVYLVRCLVRDGMSRRIDAAAATVYWPMSAAEEAQIVQWRQPEKFPGWTAWSRPASENEGLK